MNQEQLTATTDEFFNDIDPKRTFSPLSDFLNFLFGAQ
jgi:hypothetical protein